MKGPEPASSFALQHRSVWALRTGSYRPVCDSHALFWWVAWYRVACSSSGVVTAKSTGQDLILSKNSSLCLCTRSRARFVLGVQKWLILSCWRPVRCCWSYCVSGEKVGFLCSWSAKAVPVGWEGSLPARHGNRAGSVWISCVSGGGLVRLSSPVKMSQEECVSWSSGIFLCWIIRWDFCLLLSFIFHLHPTVHKEIPASVTWEAAVFQHFPKFTPERGCHVWCSCLGKTKCLSMVSSGETLTHRSWSQQWG